MCVHTHQLTTDPNGITSGFSYLTQDFQNPPVLHDTPFDLTSSLIPVHFPLVLTSLISCEQRTLPQVSPGVYIGTIQILLSPWTLDFIKHLLLFPMHLALHATGPDLSHKCPTRHLKVQISRDTCVGACAGKTHNEFVRQTTLSGLLQTTVRLYFGSLLRRYQT